MHWILKRIYRHLGHRVAMGWKPDFVISRAREGVYLYRWWVLPRNRFFNVYLHHFVGSDEDKALHDHPWVNLSIVLSGRYYEETIGAGGITYSEELKEGGIKFRWPRQAHRVQLPDNEACWTLFITGPVVRTWGFHCAKGWVPWRDFVQTDDPGAVGLGCEAAIVGRRPA